MDIDALPEHITKPPNPTNEELKVMSSTELAKLGQDLQLKTQHIALYQLQNSRSTNLIQTELTKRAAQCEGWKALAKAAEKTMNGMKNQNLAQHAVRLSFLNLLNSE
jgi:hypothetical protein